MDLCRNRFSYYQILPCAAALTISAMSATAAAEARREDAASQGLTTLNQTIGSVDRTTSQGGQRGSSGSQGNQGNNGGSRGNNGGNQGNNSGSRGNNGGNQGNGGNRDNEARARAEKERAERERAERERAAKAEKERQQAERERAAQAEREREARERAAKADKERQQAERERAAQAEREREARERAAQAEKDRAAKERAERERAAKERAEKERAEKERADRDREDDERAAQNDDDDDDTPSRPPAGWRDLEIGRVSASGPGCPTGSWKGLVDESGESFQFAFTKLTAEVTPTRNESIAQCRLTISVPSQGSGMSYRVAHFSYTGYTYLEKGVNAEFSAEYAFAGNPVQKVLTELKGPMDDEYTVDDKANGEILWSPCSTSNTLTVDVTVRLTNGKPAVDGIFEVADTVGLQFESRACK